MILIKPEYRNRIQVWPDVPAILENSGYIFTLILTEEEQLLVRPLDAGSRLYPYVKILGKMDNGYRRFDRTLSAYSSVESTLIKYQIRHPNYDIDQAIHNEVMLMDIADKSGLLSKRDKILLGMFKNIFLNVSIKSLLSTYTHNIE